MAMTDAPTERDDEGGWAKLRRRKVVQWGIAYAAGAWVLLQVVGFLADAFHWPDATKQLATIALAFGLPVALVLAWYHGDRGHQRLTGAELAVLTLLLLLGGGAVWLYGHRTGLSDATLSPATPTPGTAATATAADTRPSVAVLPFVNLSSDPANEYLADGIADTLLTMLSQVNDLKVIARTSSFSFKGKNEDVRTIGRLLGVGAVLEGSVQRANDRLRITTQLINTSDGAHLWAETYDRPADDIFKVQDEIAVRVTQALAVALAGTHGPGSIGTTNVAAYDAYLRGRARIAERQSRTIAEAVANLEKAVALDPSFGRAWAELSEAYRLSSRNVGSKTIGNLPPEQAAAQQDRAARRAVEVAPDLGLAHAALSVALMDSAPSDASLASARAVSLSPDDPDVLANRAFVLRAIEHKPDEAVEIAERAITLDPRNARRRVSLGMSLDQAGELKGALNQYREAMRMEPGFVRPYSIVGDTLGMLVGRVDGAARFLRHAEALDPSSADIKYVLATVYGTMGETRLREEKLRELRELGARHVLQWDDVREAYYEGSWEEARAGVLKHLAQDPDDDSSLSLLSAVPGSRAQTEQALQMLLAADPELPKALEPGDSGAALICLLSRAGDPEQAQVLTRRWEPYWRKLHAVGWIAEGARYDDLLRSLACAGRNEHALTELEALVQEGLDIGWRDLAVDAAYEAIRNDPRFRAVSNKLKAAETEAAARFRARPDLNDADIDSLGS